MKYDVFISHASEDKEKFVEPFAQRLTDEGLKVWYDRFELRVGDSLREKIDQGLANCRYGIVILSPHFFEKPWPKTELDGLVARQNSEGKKVILPIWHEVGFEDVKKYSPTLAGKLAANTGQGFEAVVAQILAAIQDVSPLRQSVFQTGTSSGLRERCLDTIRGSDILAWRALIYELTDPIPAELIAWKEEKGEEAARKGGEEWHNAVLDAVEICTPGFVPIVASVEAGKADLWEESFRFVRRLAILKDEMGGGNFWTIDIGHSMLYFIGHLGMSMAVKTRQLSFVDKWMSTKLQNGDTRTETSWLKLHPAHHCQEGLKYNHRAPFEIFREIVQKENMAGFFPNQDRFVECAYMANLLCSLIDFRDCLADKTTAKNLTDNPQHVILDVWPAWANMDKQRFRVCVLDLLVNSEGVLNFAVPRSGLTPDQFWPLWKQWKKVCSYWWSAYDYGRIPSVHWKYLPGEPS